MQTQNLAPGRKKKLQKQDNRRKTKSLSPLLDHHGNEERNVHLNRIKSSFKGQCNCALFNPSSKRIQLQPTSVQQL